MPEIYTHTGSEIAADVKDKFGDTGGVQIDDTMVLRWINNGILRIATGSPWLHLTAKTPVLAAQSVYDLGDLFTSSPVARVNSVLVNGTPVRIVSLGIFQQEIQKNGLVTQTATTPSLACLYGDTLTFWPVPDTTTADAITLFYDGIPPKVTSLSAALTIPDRFFTALNDYVLQQALELDERFEEAEVKRQHTETAIRENLGADLEPNDFYGTITESREW